MKNFHPKQGQIVFCKFEGLKTPEMVKERPVIIMTKKLPFRKDLFTVLPLSTTKPPKILDWHYKLDKKYIPNTPFFKGDCWVKADMVYTLSVKRMWLIRLGGGRYFYDLLPDDIMQDIKKAMWSAIDYSANKYKNGGRVVKISN